MKEIIKTTVKWNDTDEVPGKEQPIIAYTENGNIMVLKNIRDAENWKFYVSKYHIVLWDYQVRITAELASEVFRTLLK